MYAAADEREKSQRDAPEDESTSGETVAEQLVVAMKFGNSNGAKELRHSVKVIDQPKGRSQPTLTRQYQIPKPTMEAAWKMVKANKGAGNRRTNDRRLRNGFGKQSLSNLEPNDIRKLLPSARASSVYTKGLRRTANARHPVCLRSSSATGCEDFS